MNSVNDKTATHLLLWAAWVAGRALIPARPSHTALANTREMFEVKNLADLQLLQAYRSAGLNRAEQRAVLAQTATTPLPGVSVFPGGPVAQDLEWFVSTARPCNLMIGVASLKAANFYSGLAPSSEFERIS